MKRIFGIFLIVVFNIFANELAEINKVKIATYSEGGIEKYITNNIVSISYSDLTDETYQKNKIFYEDCYEKLLDAVIKLSDKEDKEFIKILKSLKNVDDYLSEIMFMRERFLTNWNREIYSEEYLPKVTDDSIYVFRGKKEKIIDILNKHFDYNGEIYIYLDADAEIYIKQDGEYFVVTFDMEGLDRYLDEVNSGNQNMEFIDKFSTIKKDNYNFFVRDLSSLLKELGSIDIFSGILVDKLGYDYGISKLNGKKIEFEYVLEGSGMLFDIFDSSKLNKRELSGYELAGDTNFYFANNSFKELFKKINEIYMTFGQEDMLTKVQSFYPQHINVLDFLENIGNEVLFAVEMEGLEKEFSLVLNSKNIDEVKDLLAHFGAIDQGDKLVLNANEFYMRDNKVFINREFRKIEKTRDTNNLFLAININLSILGEKYRKYNYTSYFYNKKDGIKSRITFDLDDLVELLTNVSNDFGGI